MKRLLIAYHSRSGHTEQLVNAAHQAAEHSGDGVHVISRLAGQTTLKDLQIADAYIFATPENFGYMSGELKALFDRTYEDARNDTAGKSYGLLISCDNDGSGAQNAIQRILTGYQMKSCNQCLIVKGKITSAALEQAKAVGQYMAVALENGII